MTPLMRYHAARRDGRSRVRLTAWATYLAETTREHRSLGLTEAPLCRCPGLRIYNRDGRPVWHRLGLSSRCRGA